MNPKVAVLSNVNLDWIVRGLSNNYDLYEIYGYNTWIQDIIEKNGRLSTFNPDIIFLILDGYELCFNEEADRLFFYTDLIENFLNVNKKSLIYISDLDFQFKEILPYKNTRFDSHTRLWEEKINNLITSYQNANRFRLCDLIKLQGSRNFYSLKNFYLGKIKYSIMGLDVIRSEIEKIIKANFNTKKKCIVLDLDNTLWGGVIGESSIDDISLSAQKEGSQYYDFQLRLKELKELGVILAISSKNNYLDAIEVINNHPNMVLKIDDFSVIKINWNSKVDNIMSISK